MTPFKLLRQARNLAMLLTAGIVYSQSVQAVSGVNPSGVNVKHNGITTVFLTFQNMAANERAVDAFWCGEVTATGVSATNPCVPGSIFGKLPARLNRAQVSGTGGQRNLTDIMTIPASVARKAFQAAARGDDSDFFYVRRFTDGINDSYVTVTCRLAGGGARSPLALTNVQLYFQTGEGPRPVYTLARDEVLPPFGAYIRYTGTGRLKGRWEVVLPGDPAPSQTDLLTEATLPVEQRGFQRRYTLIERFNRFLPPTGSVFLPGPDPSLLPNQVEGPHKILLRIEATADKEGNSNTVNGVAVSGGVAGFALPVLRYFVGSGDNALALASRNPGQRIVPLTPPPDALIESGNPLLFSWIDQAGVAMYQVQVEGDDGLLLNALVKPGESQYLAPPWIEENSDQPLRWRVRGLSVNGGEISATDWRGFIISQ